MKILFLTYVNRSGSTFLANLLSSSKKVFACLEGDLLVSLFLENPGKDFSLNPETKAKLSDVFRSDRKMQLWEIGDDVYQYLEKARTNFEAFCSVLEYSRDLRNSGASLVIFKAERLAALLKRLRKLNTSPDREILILSLVRDPRAVIASQMNNRNPFSNHFLSTNAVKSAYQWTAEIKRILSIAEISENQLVIRYEELLLQMDQTMNRISEFTSLDMNDCDPGKGDLMLRISEEQKKIHQHIGSIPQINRIDAWRDLLSPREVYLIERICRPFMEQMSYEPTLVRINILLEIQMILARVNIFIKRFAQKIRFRLR